MSNLFARASMSHAFRVPVWTSRRTSLAQVTEYVDMESVQARSETSHLSGDLDLLSFNLNELAASIHTRITIFVQHADSIVSWSVDSSLLCLFILFLLRYWNILNKALFGDAIIGTAIKRNLKCRQVSFVNVEATIVGDPVSKLSDADIALVVFVHVFKESLPI